MVTLKKGDLAFAFDPVRPTGSSTGFRGLCFVDEVGPDTIKVRPLKEMHAHVRVPVAAIHAVFSATFVAEEFLK